MTARDAGLVQAFHDGAETCPLPRAVAIIGERWTFLILRASMLGLRHFEEFQACLGIARNILSERLSRLVAAGVLARNPDPADGRKVIYALTERGAALLPVMVGLRQWALEAGFGTSCSPGLVDRRDRQPLARVEVRAHDGRPLGLHDLMWVGPDGEEVTSSPALDEGQAKAA